MSKGSYPKSVGDLEVRGISIQQDGNSRKDENENKITKDELGTFLSIDPRKGHRCYHVNPKFYQDGVELPEPGIPECDDDVSYIQFGEHNMRVYYVFRPSVYRDDVMEHIMEERFGIEQLSHIDYLFVNDDQDASLPQSFVQKLRTDVWENRQNVERLRSRLELVQTRDAGRLFRSSNPGIISPPPDTHQCMPGLPDDEAYLLLFALVTGLSLDQ